MLGEKQSGVGQPSISRNTKEEEASSGTNQNKKQTRKKHSKTRLKANTLEESQSSGKETKRKNRK